MLSTLLTSVRNQWMGALALFLVLTGGSAYALTGSNTVFTDDIVNGQVKAEDVARNGIRTDELADSSVGAREVLNDSLRGIELHNNGVGSVDLHDDGVWSADVRDDKLLGGGLRARDLRAASVGSSEALDNSLRGTDIDESTLSNLTEGTSADNFSRDGRTLTAEKTVDASPFTTTFAGRLLVLKPIAKAMGECSGPAGVSVWIEVDGTAVPGSVIRINQKSPETLTLAGVTAHSVPAGDHTARVAMECSSTATIVASGFDEVGAVSAVVLGG
jgi:hypothetical protein